MTNNDETSGIQADGPEVVHRFWVQLIAPAFQALEEGRIQLGLSHADIINQALQLWIGMIQLSQTDDLLARSRATRELRQIFGADVRRHPSSSPGRVKRGHPRRVMEGEHIMSSSATCPQRALRKGDGMRHVNISTTLRECPRHLPAA